MAKVSFLLDKKWTANGFPVKMRITANQSNASRSLGIYLQSEKDWNKDESIVRKTVPNSKEYNAIIVRELDRAEATIKNLKERNRLHIVRATDIFDLMESKAKAGAEAQDNTFFGVLERYAQLTRAEKTKQSFLYTGKLVRRFQEDTYRRHMKLFFDDIDYDWLFVFDRWMASKAPDNKSGKGLKVNTRAIHMTNIRTLFNYAIRTKVVSRDAYPFDCKFGGFKIRHAHKEKEYLPLDGLHKMIALNFDGLEGQSGLELARDMFLLSFMLYGLSPIDLYNLPKDDKGVLHVVRQKLDWQEPLPIHIKIPDCAKPIIAKYKCLGSNLLNLSRKYANYESFYAFVRHRLKRIGVMIGYKNITLYWARYSWSTYANKIKETTISIDCMLGHSQKTLAGDRYVTFDWEDAPEINDKVLTYALKDAHPKSVYAPKFLFHRGTKKPIDVFAA